jgi:hypothetical protein
MTMIHDMYWKGQSNTTNCKKHNTPQFSGKTFFLSLEGTYIFTNTILAVV